jgi:CheY-like chemotaxis protein
MGLTPEQAARLFVPFERLGAEGGDVQGTGLGLALSRRLAEAMDGALEVESEPGVGTTFRLALPCADGPPAAESVVEMVPATTPAVDGVEARSRLLYIEDNLSNVRLVEEVLRRRHGVALITAMQGRLGLDLAQRHRPDLIVLDLHLPDMHGSEVLEHLRAHPVTAAIPVVILSADATQNQIGRLLDSGAAAYLTKPLDVRRFLDVIDELAAPDNPRRLDQERSDAWTQRR